MKYRSFFRAALAGTALLLLSSAQAQQPTAPTTPFWQEQMRFPRVREAYAHKWSTVLGYLRPHRLDPAQLEIFIRAFKVGEKVEVWGRPRGGTASFALLHTYALAATSGTLGPKRRAGDGQIPEGFYTINRFNPNSLYHLSLGLDYPNETDRKSGETDLGGDIFIHGSNVTIGCLPITDPCIEELYLLAVAARAGGQNKIPVHIFPFEMSTDQMSRRGMSSPYRGFWLDLLPGYAYFNQHHQLPTTPGTELADAPASTPPTHRRTVR